MLWIYEVTNVNSIEFENSNGLVFKYSPNNEYVETEITYCACNRKQEVINRHFKNINNLYIRIKITE